MLVRFHHLDLDVVAEQVIQHLRIVRGSLYREAGAITARAIDGVTLDLHLAHLALLDFVDKVGIVD